MNRAKRVFKGSRVDCSYQWTQFISDIGGVRSVCSNINLEKFERRLALTFSDDYSIHNDTHTIAAFESAGFPRPLECTKTIGLKKQSLIRAGDWWIIYVAVNNKPVVQDIDIAPIMRV